MEYNIKIRDGPARIGEFLLDNRKIVTPNILFLDTKRFKAINLADVLITNSKIQKDKLTLKISNQFFYPKDMPKELNLALIKKYKKETKEYCIIPGNEEIIDQTLKDNTACFFIVGNASQLFDQPKKFVDFIIKLRQRIGYEKILYLPSIGDPTCFALLAYMGVDLFDSTKAIIAARNNTLLFADGNYKKSDLDELPCSCPICKKWKNTPSELMFMDILNHNYFMMLNEIKQVRNSIKNNNIRNLVETRVKSNPTLTSILRNLDQNHYSFLEKRTPVISKTKIIATSKESLNRPEIKRFQKRVIERYRKPKSSKVLVLLPCSAKKPYSFSKSHHMFLEKILSSGNPSMIHEVIITSPIGLVPRELELIYPASAYDIPVTGIWDEDEKKMIREMLTSYLKLNKYDEIIVHLPREIVEFIKDLMHKAIITCINSPTSQESLEEFSKVLKEKVKSYKPVKNQARILDNIASTLSYQFGKEVSEKILKNCVIRGKYPYQKIIYKKTQLGMVTEPRGFISFTIDGASKIADSNNYWVKIYDDFNLKGSVFSPGVKDADENIRIGDEVVVIRNNKLCAVGVAQMNGEEMKNSSHGEAVKVRHRV